MGTHPIFESDFDCLTDKPASRQTGTMSAQEDVDVADMSNKQLKERLTALGINTGPIVDSTRKLYERKLAKLLNRGKEAAYSTDEDVAGEGDNDEPVENGENAPVETAEEVVGTVEDDQPAATTEDAATTVAESTADSVDTASKSRVNTLLFLFLMLVASYLVYSERETVLAKIELATSFVTDKYTSLYYSLLPEIETTIDEQVPPPSEEL